MYNADRPGADVMLPITQKQRQKRQQNLSTALAYYSVLRDAGLRGVGVGVRGGSVILSVGATPILKITPKAIYLLSDDPNVARLADQLRITIACAICGPGATLHFRGPGRDRRMYRRAGFTVINDNISARVGRFVLGL
jgi:hypothetical protein